ncbi:major capsid protein [Chifec microvirus UA13_27]|nr:major capsid protein [Chifec microvirus UA13_27]
MSIFSSIPKSKGKRSRFNLSHSYKTTGGIGNLIPVLCREVLPGDIWNINTSTLVRLQPTLAPVMHAMSIRTECFFVPNRLLWKDWQDFITGGADGTLAPVKPFVPASELVNFDTDILKNSNYDYLGMPLTSDGSAALPFSDTPIDILPLAALQLIYNEYYRDPNLDADFAKSFPLPSGNFITSGLDLTIDELLRCKSRCWEKDYFTAALPWTQRGPQVNIPLGTSAPVVRTDTTSSPYWESSLGNPIGEGNAVFQSDGTHTYLRTETGDTGFADLVPNGTLEADLTQATSVTINDLRRSSAVQRWLENNARGGSRYIEQILAHFGVISSDSRLQRPEFLGSGKSPVIISEVLQTSGTNISGQETPQANMAGHGIGGGINHGCYRHFEEHGFIVCFASLVPRSSYVFGLEPQYTRFDKLQYAWPELAQLGEQPVYRSELDSRTESHFEEPFGYQPRYTDYKYILSRTTGEMARTLSFWQMARRINESSPVLSSQFNHINQEDFYNLFPAGEESRDQQFYMELYHNIKCSRKLPKYGTPILL